MSGVGSAVSSGLGLVLGVSQLVANVPGDFATGASFRENGTPRGRRLLLAFSFALPVLLSASLGFWRLRGAGAAIQNVALAFIVGVLLLATVEDTLPQGDEPQPPRWTSTIAFAGGFGLLALVSTLLQP